MTALRYTGLLMLVVSLAACGTSKTSERETVGTSGISATGEMNAVNDQDKMLVEQATIDGMTEVKLGELAKDKSTNEHVKAFGTRMVNDHSKAADELKGIVQRIGVAMPLKMDDEHNDLVDRLSKLSGIEFDREYMKTMVNDHTKAVELFERQTQSGQNPQLKEWAEKTLPTLRRHLELAKDVRAKVDRTTTY